MANYNLTMTKKQLTVQCAGKTMEEDLVITGPTPIEEIATTEELDMADGNMIITPNEGQAFNSVTINKPDTMLPENIKKDINIGGVVGTLESGGEQDNSILHSILNRSITEVNDSTLSGYNSDIGEGAFYGCRELTSVSISNGIIRNIGAFAFAQCTKLSSINIPYVKRINDQAFSNCTSIESFDLSNINVIGASSFDHCTNLKNITLGNEITTLYYGVFQYCTSLQSINIPKNITSIGSNCFYSCNSLSQINFEDDSSLKDIGGYAFYNCTSLTSIEIPNGVTTIGNSVFSRCSSLEQITFKGATPPTFGSTIFNSCTALQEIKVPSDSVEAYKTALGSTYASLVVADE